MDGFLFKSGDSQRCCQQNTRQKEEEWKAGDISWLSLLCWILYSIQKISLIVITNTVLSDIVAYIVVKHKKNKH